MTLASIPDFFRWLNDPWMPDSAGGFADNVDALNGFVILVCYFFVALIGSLMVLFCIKFRQKDKGEVGRGATHSTPLEIAWTLPPLAIVLVIFAVGFTGYLDMSTPPRGGNAYEIRAQAYKWGWNFFYPNGGQSTVLYVPADRPTKLTLESTDVLHSLYIPAMRAKKDCVPGRFNEMWFEPDASVVSAESPRAQYRLHCTEYCGQGHSKMNTFVEVVHTSEWDAVLAEVNKFNKDGLTPVEYGRYVWEVRGGCAQCHSVDSAMTSMQGPAWYNLYGSQRKLALSDTGEMEVVAEENYLVESIRYPNRKKAVGYAGANMSAYSEAVLSPGDVRALLEFMKSISPAHHDGTVLEAFPEGYDGREDLDPSALPAAGDGSETETDDGAAPAAEPSEPAQAV
ncbi:MAG: cytochrome c oxidase subunit II [Planctomycetota bacterium]